jgi:hypothetical protein
MVHKQAWNIKIIDTFETYHGFALLTLLCLPKTAINGDDTIWSWHFELIVDVA